MSSFELIVWSNIRSHGGLWCGVTTQWSWTNARSLRLQNLKPIYTLARITHYLTKLDLCICRAAAAAKRRKTLPPTTSVIIHCAPFCVWMWFCRSVYSRGRDPQEIFRCFAERARVRSARLRGKMWISIYMYVYIFAINCVWRLHD